jgi:hypothetical protein
MHQIKNFFDSLVDSMIRARQRQASAYIRGMIYHVNQS